MGVGSHNCVSVPSLGAQSVSLAWPSGVSQGKTAKLYEKSTECGADPNYSGLGKGAVP